MEDVRLKLFKSQLRVQLQQNYRLKYLCRIVSTKIFEFFEKILKKCEINCCQFDEYNLIKTEQSMEIFISLHSLETILNTIYDFEKDKFDTDICLRVVSLCYKISDFLFPIQSLCPEGFLPTEFLNNLGKFSIKKYKF